MSFIFCSALRPSSSAIFNAFGVSGLYFPHIISMAFPEFGFLGDFRTTFLSPFGCEDGGDSEIVSVASIFWKLAVGNAYASSDPTVRHEDGAVNAAHDVHLQL